MNQLVRGVGRLIEVLDEVTSTNDAARERALAGASHGTAVRARVQTAGRGQRGHGWASPAGGLYLSIVLRPQVPQYLMTGLPAACGIGAARALEGVGASGVRIKWPNDLVVGGAKLGGMLTEAGWAAGGVFAVCGVGINEAAPQVEGDSPRALPVTGLDACMGGDLPVPSLDALAEAVRSGIVSAVDEWAAAVARAGAAAIPLAGIMDEFYDRLAYMGEYVALIDRDGRPYAAGILTGVDAWGRALVRVDGGPGAEAAERAFDPAQVSIRPLS